MAEIGHNYTWSTLLTYHNLLFNSFPPTNIEVNSHCLVPTGTILLFFQACSFILQRLLLVYGEPPISIHREVIRFIIYNFGLTGTEEKKGGEKVVCVTSQECDLSHCPKQRYLRSDMDHYCKLTPPQAEHPYLGTIPHPQGVILSIPKHRLCIPHTSLH